MAAMLNNTQTEAPNGRSDSELDDRCAWSRPQIIERKLSFGVLAPLLLQAGYSPIPIEPGEKRPLSAVGSWQKLRTTPLSLNEIATIAAQYPNAGLGVVGGYNGLVPIDFDTEDTDVLAAIRGVLPEALVTKWGRRGFTAFYRDRSGVIEARKFKNSEGLMLVEVLATGQTVIPPSVHPATGRSYEWLTECTLLDVPVAELPVLPPDVNERLGEALKPWSSSLNGHTPPKPNGSQPVSGCRLRAYAEAALSGEVRTLRAAPHGGRNLQLFNAACKLGKYIHHGVLSEDEVEAALLDAANSNGLIRDDGHKACLRTLASGLRKAEGDELPLLGDRTRLLGPTQANEPTVAPPDMSIVKRNQVPAPAFPLDVLGLAADWVKATAESKSAPVDYVALGLLVTVAGLIGPKRRVSPWEGWEEPTILWGALVGPPSMSKSPAVDPFRDAVGAIEQERNSDWDVTKRTYEKEKKEADARHAAWEQDVATAVKQNRAPPEMPENAICPNSPTKSRLWIVDATMEKVARILGENPGGLLCFRDELAGLLGGFDKYGGSGSDRAFWIEAYGGRSYRYDRVKLDDSLDIPFCAISLLGALQPDRLSSMLLSGDDDGLASRLLYAWPDPVPPRRPSRVADNHLLLAALRRLSAIAFDGINDDGIVRARTIPLTPEAADEFQAWWEHKQWEAKLAASGRVAGAIGKLDGIALRLAQVLEFLEWGWREDTTKEPERISLQSVQSAMRLIDDWVRPNLERVFWEASLPQAQRDAMTISRWLLKTRMERINARDMRRRRGFPGPKDAGQLDAALEILVDARWLFQPSADGHGRPRKDFIVNQAIYEAP